MIRLRDVWFTYRDAAEPALRGVSLSVARGELVVVMGATEAGKTTLAKCLNRIVPAFQQGTLRGEIEIAGRVLRDEGVAELAESVGLVSQDFEAQLFASTVRDEVAFAMEQRGVSREVMSERLGAALQQVGLTGFDERDPATLSGGEKQRLAIAAMLALRPDVLVFDEPTTDLDPLGKIQIFEVLAALREQGATIVLIEHEIAAAQRADRLVLLDEGRVVAEGHPTEMLPEVERLEACGVRPPDLERLARAIGRPQRLPGLEPAQALFAPLVQPERFVPRAAHGAGEELLTVRNVTHRFEGGHTALADVSVTIRAGELVALIGQNGSGKTTLARHMNGLLRPTQGEVRLHGEDLRTLPLNRVAADVGYVFQNPDHQIFSATVEEEVAFGPRNFGYDAEEIAARTTSALAAVGLVGLEQEDPFLFGKGQRQRLAVASLLALRPRVLILDEPTTGLDYREQRRMMELLAQLHRQGMTIVAITHSPWVVAEYAERGILMQEGKVRFDGALRALFEQPDLLTECHFRIPDVTQLGARFGFTPLSLEEFLTTVNPQPITP